MASRLFGRPTLCLPSGPSSFEVSRSVFLPARAIFLIDAVSCCAVGEIG